MKVTQSCLTFCDPMDYTVHGILQARILGWVDVPSSGDLPNPGIKPSSPALQVDSLPAEPQGKPGPQRIISALVRLVKAMDFPVVMYGCKSCTTKKAECQRIDAFELWCWKRLLRVPWTARRSNKSILKEISPGCSLEGLMLKVKL